MESIGVHRLTNHNLMDGIDDLMVGLQADIALIDPPWGEGNEKYWHTALAKVDPKTNIILDYLSKDYYKYEGPDYKNLDVYDFYNRMAKIGY